MVVFLLVAGFLLELLTGSLPGTWFSFPGNLWVALGFVTLFTSLYLWKRTTKWVLLLSSVPFAITTIVTLGILTIGLGSIGTPQTSGGGVLEAIGLTNITTTWYFALIFLLVLVNLWFVILKRTLFFQKRNLTFLLNHFGLWLTLFAGVLGQGDLVRLNMTLKKDAPEWRAVDAQGHTIELPIALELKQFNMEIYPNKLFVINREGTPLPSNNPSGFLLEKSNSSHTILNWKLTLHQYIDSAVLVKDSAWGYNPMWGSTNAAYVTVENLKTGHKQTGWVASGNFQFPPQTITLDSNHLLVMAPPEAKKFESEVLVYEKGKEEHRKENIQVNHPISVKGWKIYQTSYDEKLGRWSNVSVVELVLDPWLPMVYTGIFILIAGSIAFLIQNRK